MWQEHKKHIACDKNDETNPCGSHTLQSLLPERKGSDLQQTSSLKTREKLFGTMRKSKAKRITRIQLVGL